MWAVVKPGIGIPKIRHNCGHMSLPQNRVESSTVSHSRALRVDARGSFSQLCRRLVLSTATRVPAKAVHVSGRLARRTVKRRRLKLRMLAFVSHLAPHPPSPSSQKKYSSLPIVTTNALLVFSSPRILRIIAEQNAIVVKAHCCFLRLRLVRYHVSLSLFARDCRSTKWTDTTRRVIAATGGGLNYVSTQHRPFSLLDLNISFPLVTESVSTTTLALVALAAPAVIIVLVALIFVPGKDYRQMSTRSQVIRRKLWETYCGLTGLALSVAAAFFVTQGLKNLFGKPRPHLLALCDPDIANLAAHVVGGYGQDISPRWTLVDSSICRQKDQAVLNDAFRSFPSGHSSFSWSGLLYLALFICSKFAISIPYLPMTSMGLGQMSTQPPSDDIELLAFQGPAAGSSAERGKSPSGPETNNESSTVWPLYNQAAAAPTYGLVMVMIPLAVAAYITSTRYVEFWHFGIDVLSGALIGIATAWLSFRWYHLPVQRGQGWAWGARSRERAFGIGVGVGTYVGPEGWDSKKAASRDVEAGRA